MKKIIIVGICVIALCVSIFAGAKYTELSEQQNVIIKSQSYDTKLGEYLIEVEIQDGFGRTIDTRYYYSENELM